MAKFKDKNDAANISHKNGVEWYHFSKMIFIGLMTLLKEDKTNEVKIRL